MKAQEIYERPWFGVDDAALHTPLAVTIANVRTVIFRNGRWTRVIAFREHPRELKLNRTRFEDIATALDENDDDHQRAGPGLDFGKTGLYFFHLLFQEF